MLTRKFLESYPNRQKYILKHQGQSWTTRKDTLTNKLFINYWRDQNIFLGLRHGDTTNFFTLDIDTGSQYHPNQDKNAIRAIQKLLKSKGLPASNPIHSSDSGGIHIYYHLAQSFNSDDLATCIYNVFTEAGYVVKAGQLEIFPNVRKSEHSEFNGLRLPMQSGSTMLDVKTLEPIKSDMKLFQEVAEECRILNAGFRLINTPKTFSNESEGESSYENVGRVRTRYTPKSEGVSAPWEEFFDQDLDGMSRHLLCILNTGFTNHGQTNYLVLTVTRLLYIQSATKDPQIIANVIRAMKGYDKFCNHKKEIVKRVKDCITKIVDKNLYYPIRNSFLFKKYKKKLDKFFNKTFHKQIDITEKLVDCAKQLLAENDTTLNTKTSWLQKLAKLAQTSMQTLYKYFDDVLKIYFERHQSQIRCNVSPSKDYTPKKTNTYLVLLGRERNNNLDQTLDNTVSADDDSWMYKTREEIEALDAEEEWEDWDDWDSLPPKPKEEPKKVSDTEFRELVQETVGIERAMELRLLESVMGKNVYYNLSEPEDEDEDDDNNEGFVYPWQNKYRVFKPSGVFA